MAQVNPGQQPFPYVNTRLVDEDGLMTKTWYWLFVAMWKRLGAGVSILANSVFIQTTPSGILQAFNASTGALIGDVVTANVVGGTPQVQALGLSPFIFTAGVAGTLLIDSGAIAISRDAGVTWYGGGVTGGQPHVLAGDRVRVIWYGASPPNVVFFPDIGS